MFKLSNYPLLRYFSGQDEAMHRRIRLIGYVAGVSLCYLIPDEWFHAAGLWFRAVLTVLMNRVGLR